MKTKIWLFATLLIQGATACWWYDGDVPEEYASFFEIPIDQHEDSLAGYSAEEQVEIYLIGVQEFHPPLLHLAYAVARQERDVVPVVLQRLPDVESEYEKLNLIHLVEVMTCAEGMDLGSDSSVVHAIEMSIDSMRFEEFRLPAFEKFQRIRNNCSRTSGKS